MASPEIIATVCFRVIAILGGVFGALNALVLLLFAGPAGPDRVVPGLSILAAAGLLFYLAPRLGKLATLGLPTRSAPPNER